MKPKYPNSINAKEWAESGMELTPKAWYEGMHSKSALIDEMIEGLGVSADEAKEIVREAAAFYQLTSKSSAESRVFAMNGLKNPLLSYCSV